jgi:hypothetical protein
MRSGHCVDRPTDVKNEHIYTHTPLCVCWYVLSLPMKNTFSATATYLSPVETIAVSQH